MSITRTPRGVKKTRVEKTNFVNKNTRREWLTKQESLSIKPKPVDDARSASSTGLVTLRWPHKINMRLVQSFYFKGTNLMHLWKMQYGTCPILSHSLVLCDHAQSPYTVRHGTVCTSDHITTNPIRKLYAFCIGFVQASWWICLLACLLTWVDISL